MNAFTVILCATALLASVASAQMPPGATGGASAPLGQQAHFAQHCPARVQTLLAAATPGYKATEDTIKGICGCAQTRLEAAGELSMDDPVPPSVNLAALACAKPTVIAYDEEAVSKRFGAYLRAQPEWKPEDVPRFATCMAETHWRSLSEARQSSRPQLIDLPTLWRRCTTEIGRPGTPLPDPALSQAPTTAP